MYTLPCANYFIDGLHGPRYFTRIDLRICYHHICIVEHDNPKRAYGNNEFLVIPFGFTNAPTIQKTMNDIFLDKLGEFFVIFLDDTLIYSCTL